LEKEAGNELDLEHKVCHTCGFKKQVGEQKNYLQ